MQVKLQLMIKCWIKYVNKMFDKMFDTMEPDTENTCFHLSAAHLKHTHTLLKGITRDKVIYTSASPPPPAPTGPANRHLLPRVLLCDCNER